MNIKIYRKEIVGLPCSARGKVLEWQCPTADTSTEQDEKRQKQNWSKLLTVKETWSGHVLPFPAGGQRWTNSNKNSRSHRFVCASRPWAFLPVCLESAAAIHQRGGIFPHTWPLLPYISQGSLKDKCLYIHMSARADMCWPACFASGMWTVTWVGNCWLHTWDVRHHLLKRPLCPQLLVFQRTGRTALAEDIVWDHTFADGFDGRHFRGNLIPNFFFLYLWAGWWVTPTGALGPPGWVCSASSGLCRLPGCFWPGSCLSSAGGAASQGCGRRFWLETKGKTKIHQGTTSQGHGGSRKTKANKPNDANSFTEFIQHLCMYALCMPYFTHKFIVKKCTIVFFLHFFPTH